MKWFEDQGVKEGKVEMFEEAMSCTKWKLTHTLNKHEPKKFTLGEKRLHHKLNLII